MSIAGAARIIQRPDGTSSAVIAIDCALYPEEAALKAVYWLTDRCHLHIWRPQDGSLAVELWPKDGARLSLQQACGEFCNALADAALRIRISAETAPIQEALLQRAFLQLMPRQNGG